VSDSDLTKLGVSIKSLHVSIEPTWRVIHPPVVLQVAELEEVMQRLDTMTKRIESQFKVLVDAPRAATSSIAWRY
jgi:hypothetical protein